MTTMHKWNDENGIRHGSSMAIERAHTAQLADIGETVGHRHNHADTAEPQRESRGDAARA
jgi:hypothetical protein